MNTTVTLDVTLELGEIGETVTVQASTSQLNSQDATIGNAFNELKVRQLPFNAPVKVERNTHIARFDFDLTGDDFDLTGDGKHLVF